MIKKIALFCFWLTFSQLSWASHLFIPMDENQADHLKAYGISYWVLQNDIEVDWLLNYRGGSFMFKYYQKFENELASHRRQCTYKEVQHTLKSFNCWYRNWTQRGIRGRTSLRYAQGRSMHDGCSCSQHLRPISNALDSCCEKAFLPFP